MIVKLWEPGLTRFFEVTRINIQTRGGARYYPGEANDDYRDIVYEHARPEEYVICNSFDNYSKILTVADCVYFLFDEEPAREDRK